jgi:hypothetical protein
MLIAIIGNVCVIRKTPRPIRINPKSPTSKLRGCSLDFPNKLLTSSWFVFRNITCYIISILISPIDVTITET